MLLRLRLYYIEHHSGHLTQLQYRSAQKFDNNLRRCASFSMYRQSTTGHMEHISSHTCSHKACMVCNFLRQKKIRRKYFRWFEDNPVLGRVYTKAGKAKILTASQIADKYPDQEPEPKPYHIMHLTLTVPHTTKGWRGQYFYQRQLKKAFWLLRKYAFWTDNVYGGESGVEITKNDDGLHIHIHALLLVRRSKQSRNTLYREILLAWNRLTIDPQAKRKKFTAEQLQAISRGNKLITEEDLAQLHPSGSTLVGLENAYMRNEHGRKIYLDRYEPQSLTAAILEIISYHFEPTAFDKKEGKFNLPLLMELLPELHNLRIYDKFGCLYYEKALNLRDNSYQSDMAEAVQAKATADGEPTPPAPERGYYFVTNPAYVYHDVKQNYKIVLSHKAAERAIALRAHTTEGALRELGYLARKEVEVESLKVES